MSELRILGFFLPPAIYLASMVADFVVLCVGQAKRKVARAFVIAALTCLGGGATYMLSPLFYQATWVGWVAATVVFGGLAALPSLPHYRASSIVLALVPFSMRWVASLWLCFSVASSIWP